MVPLAGLVEAIKKFNVSQMIWLAIISFLVCHLFMTMHQGNNFLALSDAAYGVIDGHPHWITYQNRLLGPFTVLILSKVGFSFLTALKIFYVLGITIQIFLLDLLLRRTGCSETRSLSWVLFYCFLFIIYQHGWFYTWDVFDILLFTVFSYFVLHKKPTYYFVLLFFIALLNRESALFIALFLIVKGISIDFSNKLIHIKLVRTTIIGFFLLLFGICWTHSIRLWLFISSPQWILNLKIPDHSFFGNMIQIQNLYNLYFGPGTIRDALWVFGSIILLCRIGKPISREYAYLLFIYIIYLLSLLLFGLVGETRM